MSAALSQTLGDVKDAGIVEEGVRILADGGAERAVGLDVDVVLPAKLDDLFLREVWMNFNLGKIFVMSRKYVNSSETFPKKHATSGFNR